MYRFLLQPRWITASILVAVLTALFVNLGFWQLSRHRERALDNQVTAQRLAEAPLPIEDAVAGAGEDVATLEYRTVTATGSFRTEEEVLVRSQVHNGQAGFWVVTPFELLGGELVLVNRGWIPLAFDTVPVRAVPPPGGVIEISGLARLSQVRPPFGPVEPPGKLTGIARIDIDRLSEQMPGPLLPVWMQLDSEGEELPIPLPPPGLETGPHISYAIQWFSFAVIGVAGFGFLVRKQAQR